MLNHDRYCSNCGRAKYKKIEGQKAKSHVAFTLMDQQEKTRQRLLKAQ
jgi:hypothetical protein